MIGKYQIQLGAEQLTSGMASSDYATDGALGTSSTGLNPFIANRGVMYAMASPTDISTNVAGSIVASCEDSNAVSPNNRYFIDDATNAANYYSYNGTSVTKVKTGTATGTTYVQGKSDFISFNGFFYGSTATVLNKWDGTSGAGLTEAYQTFADANAHHPMIAYQGLLYVGDGNTLSTLTTGGTYTTGVLTLQAKEKIVALGIDPGTGLMMISIQTIYDTSDTIPSLKAVYLYDGISAKPSRKILVDDLITAFYPLEGQVIVGAGQTIGTWNGSGVTFLRNLKNAGLSNTELPYKHHFANIKNILFVVDGKDILAYGTTIYGAKKGFFYTANTQGSNKASCIMPLGSNKLGVAVATNKLYSFDTSSTSAGSASMYFNNIYFPRPVYVRRVRIITTGITTTGDSGIGGFVLFDEKNNTIATQTQTFLVVAAASPKYVFDFDYSQAKLQGLQARLNYDTQGYGVVRVYIYYDIAE